MTFSSKQSAITSQSSSNGGRFTRTTSPLSLLTQKVSAIAVPHSDRFVKRFIYNETETTEENVAVSLGFPQVSAETAVYLAAATQRDTQLTLAPARYYGIGKLTAGVSIGASVLSVQFPAGSAALNVVMAGDKLVLRSPVSGGSRADTELEHATVDAVTWLVDVATITLTATITKNWAIYATVASAITAATVSATLDNAVKTNCVIDHTQIVLTNAATVEQTFTLTFTSATAFTATGDTLGALASGDKASLYAPLNPDTNTPLFSIPAVAWTSATTGATFVFQTHPAAIPFWTLARFFDGETAQTETNAASVCVSGF